MLGIWPESSLKNVNKLPWSSDYGKRLTFRRSWVRITAPYTGWTFFTYICFKNCNDVCLKRPSTNEKEAGIGPFFFKKTETMPRSVVVAKVDRERYCI